jgi:3-deoxy-D-manno-octulosonic-acid transferase
MRELGFRAEGVRVVGNLKFDAAKPDTRRDLDARALLRQLGVAEDALVVVAGSTHAGEETILAERCARLRARFPSLFLVLVPRHFERARAVVAELESLGVKFAIRSEVKAETRFKPGEVDCLLVNTTGELKYFYECASVVFVGKSLTAEGGQNPIEPGALGRAMIFGPNMQNFAPIAAEFVAGQGAVQVADAAELERALGDLLGDAERRVRLGRAALAVVQRNQGATERTVAMILAGLGRS